MQNDDDHYVVDKVLGIRMKHPLDIVTPNTITNTHATSNVPNAAKKKSDLIFSRYPPARTLDLDFCNQTAVH
jgi:hypothetical protein